MKTAEIAGIKIKLGDDEKVITVEQARELQAALNELLGAKPADMVDAMRKLAEKMKQPEPIRVPMPYPVHPPINKPRWVPPYREPQRRFGEVWCGPSVRAELISQSPH